MTTKTSSFPHASFPRAGKLLLPAVAVALTSLASGCGGEADTDVGLGYGGAGSGAFGSPDGGIHDGSGGPGDSPGSPGSPSGGGTGGGGVGTDACASGALIDNLEHPDTYASWRPFSDGTGSMTPASTMNAEASADGGSKAVHLSGSGFTQWGAGIGRTFEPDAACVPRSTGFRFRAKGPGVLTIAAPVAAVVPPADGGTCTSGDECNNSHETKVTLSASWQEYTVSWSDLSQAPGWGLTAAFDQEEVVELLFSARPDQQPFDFWIDDVHLVDGGAPDDGGGTGGGTGNPGTCALDAHLGEAEFLKWYSARRNSFYTYQNLCKALQKFPAFATTGSVDAQKREIAAFFANVSRETGELEYIEQIVKDPPTYFGRGPMQLTHSYNYQSAGDALGVNLIGNPGLVATDGVITWETALWFWMKADGAGKGTCHAAITGSAGFGQTINIINGGLECGSYNDAANQRITYYNTYVGKLGTTAGSNLTCW